MTNREFYELYSSEDKCLTHFKTIREKEGICCKKCKGTIHYWLNSKRQFQCKNCRFRTGIKSGTLFENSKIPLAKSYEAFHLVTSSKKPISAKTIERHLKIHYESAWFLLQKIRIALGRRNAEYMLSGDVEVDECMLSVIELNEETNAEDHQTKKKRGRGADMAKILVMTSSDERKNRRYLKCVAMEVIEDFNAQTFKDKMTNWIKKNSRIYADKSSSYRLIKQNFNDFVMKVSSGELAKENLPTVHPAIGNKYIGNIPLRFSITFTKLSR